MISIFEPYLKGNELKYVTECVKTNWISSQGKFIKNFEESLASYHTMPHGVATSSCTSALHLSLKALGIGEGDEVICPALTFISPANMVVLSGAKLKLVDIDSQTLCLDPEKISQEITPQTKAIIVVHQFGHAAPMDEILALAKKHSLFIIEDNAESLGAYYKGQILGSFGDVSTYSFFGNKIISCGEGGAILCKDKSLNQKIRELRDHGMSKEKRYFHNDLGYNYRMTNLQAAVGCAQLEKLDEILKIRQKQQDVYYDILNDIEEVQPRQFAPWTKSVHWMTTITIDKKFNRDDLLEHMKKNGIDVRQMINPVHWASHFKEKFSDSDFPNTISASKQSLHLPSSTALSEKDIQKVCSTIKKFF